MSEAAFKYRCSNATFHILNHCPIPPHLEIIVTAFSMVSRELTLAPLSSSLRQGPLTHRQLRGQHRMQIQALVGGPLF